MYARDANNATWFILRYERDFQTPERAQPLPVPPNCEATLFYDRARHVLELVPMPPADEAHLTPPPAVDVNGEVYRIDPQSGRLFVRLCDGSEKPLICEPGVIVWPAGLALDRRGFLYVADPGAARVVVLSPEDRHVEAILDGGRLREPVDVAIAPDGRIYVADRELGQIVIYNARFQSCGYLTIPPPNEKVPLKPQPISVMVDEGGTLMIADARHPRLIRLALDGSRLADIELTARVRELNDGGLSIQSPAEIYGKLASRFVVGACGPLYPLQDGGQILAAAHRALRLLNLHLGRQFASRGIFLSAALDSGRLSTNWHRIDIDADIPAGTSITIATASAEKPESLNNPASWGAPRPDPDKIIIPYTPDRLDQLIQSGPGRYLRLQVTLTSDGRQTPSLRSIRVSFPRNSYLDLLPRIYRRDPESAQFLSQFLSLFEREFTGIEDRYEDFSRQLDPAAAPPDVLKWLAALLDLSFDPSWPTERRRALLGRAMELYRVRGTVRGIEEYVEIYTGMRPVVIEQFLRRPTRPAYLGSAGGVLGVGLQLIPVQRSCGADFEPELPQHDSVAHTERLAATSDPRSALFAAYAHRFIVLAFLENVCDAEAVLPVVNRIVEVNKPAHTAHVVRIIYPEAQVGVQTTVGVDFVLGGRTAPHMTAGARETVLSEPPAGGVLGKDSVLGSRRPQYVSPIWQPL